MNYKFQIIFYKNVILLKNGQSPIQCIKDPLKKSVVFFENPQKLAKFAEKWCDGLKTHRNLEWCKGKSVELEKC